MASCSSSASRSPNPQFRFTWCPDRPLQSWKTFVRNHMEGIASIDLFVVPTIAFQQLFAFLVLGHERRRLLSFAVTRNPTAEWLADRRAAPCRGQARDEACRAAACRRD